MDDHEERKDEVAESLNPSQRNAISHVRSQALSLRPDALSTIHHVLHMSNLLPAASVHAQLLAAIRRHATVAIHFHPDRPVLGRRPSRGARPPTVVQALLEDGLYRNQFETGISNGSRGRRRMRPRESPQVRRPRPAGPRRRACSSLRVRLPALAT
ncbi:hypothetical protein VTK73DRAFT_6439 [Phialemonium thermophilum]|uniref:Uncharacterized protein n=1 Tax=Phialemonium thermophilum TaxID=223376 RepID=A0ABR3UZS3_9PEZI